MVNFFDVTNIHLYLGIALSVVNAVLLCFEGYKFLQIIQLSGYKMRGYFDWLQNTRGKYVMRLLVLTVLSSACLIITNVIFNAYLDYLAYIGLIFYFAFSVIFIYNMYNAPQKTPLKMTNRMNRSIILLFIVNLIISFGLIALSSMFIDVFRFGAVALTPITLPLTVPFVHWVMQPIEKAINHGFLRQAKKKLDAMPNLIRIGITGSFGKTSTKNFLQTILAEKYSVFCTPFSYNTPMGMTKSVIQFLSPSHQIFIAEMGARSKGDIKELCELVEPTLGIITSVGEQHMATFKTLDNVIATKGELADYVGHREGFCVFNADSAPEKNIYENFAQEKMLVSVEKKADVYATDIKSTQRGTDFTLNIKGKDPIHCSTRLLGKHNISNLLLCVAMAVKLGLSDQEITTGISKVMPVDHRLQLIHAENDVTILDDTYNASIEGSQRALEVLKMFEGRKIVITPGLVELGTLERLSNYEFGERIAKVADIVIIVNKAHYLSIKQGLIDSGFDSDKIYYAENLKSTQDQLSQLLQKGDVILWENDLPDNYT